MNKVYELRSKLKMTQEEFAEFCGLARISVARYETTGNIGRAAAEKIAQACGVSVGYVLGYTDDDPKPAQPERMKEWNVEYPAGVALRTATKPKQDTGLSERDIRRIAEQVAQINRDEKTSPVLNKSEQALIEDYRLLTPAQRIRVQRLIGAFLDLKFTEE